MRNYLATVAAVAAIGLSGCTAPAPLPSPSPSPVEVVWPPVTTFDQAVAQCDSLAATATDASDCINAAIIEWCEFIPFAPTDPHYDPSIDGRCTEAD